MVTRSLSILAALSSAAILCACSAEPEALAAPAPTPPEQSAEMAAIERECLDYATTHRNALSCDWGSLIEARRWRDWRDRRRRERRDELDRIR